MAATTSTLSVEGSSLVERWTLGSIEGRTYGTALVVGITEDSEARGRFEDKLVSHLRGRDIRCMTGQSIVPDLAEPGERSTSRSIARSTR